jgi:hypothetical protein
MNRTPDLPTHLRSSRIVSHVVALCLAAGLSHTASAATLTAVCKDPVGRAIGFRGALGDFQPIDSPDGYSGALITLVLIKGANQAQITFGTATNQGARPLPAPIVGRTTEQISFVVNYPGAVFLYSLFLNSSTLLISDHGPSLGFESSSAVNKAFQARCSIEVR